MLYFGCASCGSLGPRVSEPSDQLHTDAPLGAESSIASARWVARSQEAREAMRAGHYREAESIFVSSLESLERSRPSDARVRATLGNLVRLASILRRLEREGDADRVMSKVSDYVAAKDHEPLRVEYYHARYQALSERPLDPVDQALDAASIKRPKFRPSVESLIKRSARKYQVDPQLVKAVVAAESNFDKLAVSETGAQGLMQLMPETAKAMGVRAPFQPSQNINGGVRYLRSLLDRYARLEDAIAAYNAGPSAVDRYRGIPPYPETQAYVERVLRFYREYRDENTP